MTPELYRQLLGLRPLGQSQTWTSTSRRIGPRFRRLSPDAAFECPVCGKPAPRYDRRELRTWRHLDTMQFKTYLIASLPRVECKEHGIQTVKVSWCEPGSRFTILFERVRHYGPAAARVQARRPLSYA